MSKELCEIKDEQPDKPEDVSSLKDYSIKHRLKNCWTLWYYENDRKNTSEGNLEIASFQTVEDFWSLYNHIKTASKLKPGCSYSLFKQGVKPMWKDAVHKRGGRWIINLKRKQRNTELDGFWLDIILCLVGEAFDNSDEVCGAVVSIRNKADKIALWTSDAYKSVAVLEIGRKLKERLKIPLKIMIGYQIHKGTMDKSRSMATNIYTV